MEKRRLGKNGPAISLVGLGCNNFGARIDLEAARTVIHKALDLGVTHFDTADVYGNSGGSETVIGAVLGARRDEVFLATKFGKPMAGRDETHRGSRRYLVAAVEASLRRLKTDRIDLLYQHEADPGTLVEETLRALEELVRTGKVGHVAASNFSGAELEEAAAVAGRLGVPGFIAAQEELSLLARRHEKTLFPAMEKLGLGLIPYFPLSGGALTGKYRKGAALPAGTRHASGSPRFLDPHWDTIEALAAFAEARGHTLVDLAMSWLVRRPLVVSVIAGATRPEQVEANVRAIGWELTPADMAEIDRIASPA